MINHFNPKPSSPQYFVFGIIQRFLIFQSGKKEYNRFVQNLSRSCKTIQSAQGIGCLLCNGLGMIHPNIFCEEQQIWMKTRPQRSTISDVFFFVVYGFNGQNLKQLAVTPNKLQEGTHYGLCFAQAISLRSPQESTLSRL
jgi:hypothetical protein